jgi:hypothetical protein
VFKHIELKLINNNSGGGNKSFGGGNSLGATHLLTHLRMRRNSK